MLKLYSGILGFALTSVAVLTSANAADVYSPSVGGLKDGPYVPFVSWTGFYLGGNLGAVWGDLETKDIDALPGKFESNTTDILGGGQFGYNFQAGKAVFGVEVDVGGLGFDGLATQPGTGGLISSKIEGGFYGDVTGRLGYAFDRTLVYAKGGFAFFDGNVTVTDGVQTLKNKDTFTGWTVGGGIERKFLPDWSIKAEYQFFDFGSESGVIAANSDRYKLDLTAQTVKVGVNYAFGHSYAPLK